MIKPLLIVSAIALTGCASKQPMPDGVAKTLGYDWAIADLCLTKGNYTAEQHAFVQTGVKYSYGTWGEPKLDLVTAEENRIDNYVLNNPYERPEENTCNIVYSRALQAESHRKNALQVAQVKAANHKPYVHKPIQIPSFGVKPVVIAPQPVAVGNTGYKKEHCFYTGAIKHCKEL